MIACDKCGKKIIMEKQKYRFTIYRGVASYIDKMVDLCDDCQEEFNEFIGKAQSYFIVNKDNSNHIFDGLEYWDENL